MAKRRWTWVCGLLLLSLLWPQAAGAETERTDNSYYTLADESGRVLLITGIEVSIGDRFVDNDDSCYEVTRLEGDTAYARLIGKVSRSGAEAAQPALVPSVTPAPNPPAPVQHTIGIYSSHSGESYRGNDGRELVQGRGEIYDVGATMKNVLGEFGINGLQSDTLHTPSGGISQYAQSRRTALKLLQSGAEALFDIHRDTAPAREYAKTVEGKEVARVLFVLGRQNAAIKANEELVFRLRNKANELYPNLIRGVFYAHGLYNQDLSPAALLIEVGSAGNTLEEATSGIALFTTVIPPVLYGIPHNPAEAQQQAAAGVAPGTGPGTPGTPPGGRVSSGAAKAIAWLLTLTTLGGIFFLALNEGSLDGIWRRLKQFRSIEFTNFLGRLPRRSRTPHKDK